MGVRTPDPLLAKQVLSQLSYRPARHKTPFQETGMAFAFVDGGRTGTRTWDLHLIRMAL
jgi:hypothetical protein